ncbi:MAG: hypothetical protein KF763_09000 [Cyclobacteriaceae bacterium]|nr:hypothetical protein [Cyclobacteriaceae bacterium]
MKILLLSLFVLSVFYSHSQPVLFGDKCLGKWEGTMHIFTKGVLKDSVAVRHTVEKLTPTSWSWKTEYLSPTRPMVKDYVLRTPDPNQNKYITDEGGGLELTDYLFGNKLYSVFETHEVLLTSSYELLGETLIFEVTSGKKEPAGHPEVKTYSTTTLQRVVLRRIAK